jgi:hypothetical protein
MKIDWKPIILWGGGAGALVAFWAGLWITGFLMAWGEGWLHPGIEVPARYAEHLRLPPEVALRWFEDLIGCALPRRLASLLALITALGAVAGAAVASVGRLLKLDPGLVALKSFWWSLRAATRPMVVLTSLAVIGSASLGFVFESEISDGWLGWVVIGVAAALWFLLWIVIIPVLVCRGDVVGGGNAPRWWRPRWPGRRPVAIFLAIGVLSFAPGWLLTWFAEEVGGPSGIAYTVTLADLAWSVVVFVAPLMQCAVLMRVPGTVIGFWRRSFRWSILGPWIALHGWWTVILAILVPPVLAVYVWLWKFAPVLATILESAGRFFPYTYHLFINTSNFVGNFWWLLFVVPSMFFFWLGVARFVVLTQPQDRRQKGQDEPLATYEDMAHDEVREAEALDWTESTSCCLDLP